MTENPKQTITCKQCGYSLSPDHKGPCPKCGDTKKKISLELTEHIKLRDSASMSISRLPTIVFIDASNYHYGLQKLGWKIDYEKFKTWLYKNYSIIELYYYAGIHSKKSFLDTHPQHKDSSRETIQLVLDEYIRGKNKFFKKLRYLGYKVYSKPISSVYDETKGGYVLKCNCDVELTMDVLFRTKDYEQIILCSGDGDFVRLVKFLKSIGKRVIVMGVSKRISYLLKKHCNELITLNSLRNEIEYSHSKAENAT